MGWLGTISRNAMVILFILSVSTATVASVILQYLVRLLKAGGRRDSEPPAIQLNIWERRLLRRRSVIGVIRLSALVAAAVLLLGLIVWRISGPN